MAESAGAVETVEQDIGTSPADTVRRWKAEIALAEKAVETWHKSGDAVVDRYRDEKVRKGTHKFNILWSNTETLKPAVYGQTPLPDVRRRINDPKAPDESAREAADILERGLSYSMDEYDFDNEIRQAVEDWLLPGRGVVRLRYIPTMELGEPPKQPIEFINIEADDEGTEIRREFFIGDERVDAESVQGAEGFIGGAGLFDLRGEA